MNTDRLITRIADEINRQRSDLIGSPSLSVGYVINREINAAIQHYESTRFRWNEVREEEFGTTTASTRTATLPPLAIEMDGLKLVDGSAYVQLRKETWAEIERLDRNVTGSQGVPKRYAIYGNVIRFYPVPDATYTLVGSYLKRSRPTSLSGSYCAVIVMGGASLTATSTASHNNHLDGWTTDGEELIRARAKAAVLINYLGNEVAIMAAGQMAAMNQPYLSVHERQAFERLADEAKGNMATGRIRPSRI